LNSQG